MTYADVDPETIKIMYEACVKQGIDFSNLDTIPFTAGFKAGVKYMQDEIKRQADICSRGMTE